MGQGEHTQVTYVTQRSNGKYMGEHYVNLSFRSRHLSEPSIITRILLSRNGLNVTNSAASDYWSFSAVHGRVQFMQEIWKAGSFDSNI